MSRYAPQIAAGSALNEITASLVAGENIKKGDLVTLGGADGLGYYAVEPTMSRPDLRPIMRQSEIYDYGLADATIVATAATSTNGYEGCTSILLDDNAMVIGYFNGANSKREFVIVNADGTLRKGATAITNANRSSSPSCVSLAKLKSGGFVVAAFDTTGPWVGVYDAQGSVIKAPASVDGTLATSATFSDISCVALSGGGFVVAWATSLGQKYQVFNADGTQVTASSTLSTSAASGPRVIALSAAQDGGFFAGWVLSVSPYGAQVGKFDAAGVLQVSKQISTSGSDTANKKIRIATLKGGGLIAMYNPAPSAGVYLAIYDGALNIQGGLQQPDTTYTHTGVAPLFDVVALSDGNAAAVFIGSVSTPSGSSTATTFYAYAMKFSPTGVVLVPKTIIYTNATVNTGGTYQAFPAANGGFFFAISSYSGGESAPGSVYVAVDSVLNVKSRRNLGGSAAACAPSVFEVPNAYDPRLGCYLAIWNENSSMGNGVIKFQFIAPYMQSMIPVGVAKADTAKGARIPLTVAGVAKLRFTFKANMVADYSANFAQKFSIIGDTAILKGIQA